MHLQQAFINNGYTTNLKKILTVTSPNSIMIIPPWKPNPKNTLLHLPASACFASPQLGPLSRPPHSSHCFYSRPQIRSITRSTTAANIENVPTPSVTNHWTGTPSLLPPRPQPPPRMALPIKHSIQNQFSLAYKTDERIIPIFKKYVECTNRSDKIKFIPYCRSKTITSLGTKNNQGPPTPPLKKTNDIYQYQCSHIVTVHISNNIFIGLNTTTLSRRLKMHQASGGPKQHALENHNLTLTRDDLVNNTKIFFNEFNHNKLSIIDALLIRKLQPSINNQSTVINRTLKLFT